MTNLRDVISHCGGVIGKHQFLIDKFLKVSKPVEPDDPMDDDKSEANNTTKGPIWSRHFFQVSTKAVTACY